MDEDLRALERAAATAPGDARAWLRLAQAFERLRRPHACLAAARRAVSVDPSLPDAVALARRVFSEIAKPLGDAELRSVIGEALRLGGALENPSEWHHFELLAGTHDPSTGTVAWIEDRTRPRRGAGPSVDCHTELKVARSGRVVRTWPLAHYNPFFWTNVFHLHVEGEHAFVVYHEKHGIVAALVPFDGEVRFVRFPSSPVFVLPDRVFFVGGAEGPSVSAYTLPDLERCAEIPLRGEPARNAVRMDEAVGGWVRMRHVNRGMRVDGGELCVPLADGGEERVPLGELGPTPLEA